MEDVYVSPEDFFYILENSWETDADRETYEDAEIHSVEISEFSREGDEARYTANVKVDWDEEVSVPSDMEVRGNISEAALRDRPELFGLLEPRSEAERGLSPRKRMDIHLPPLKNMMYDLDLQYQRYEPKIDEKEAASKAGMPDNTWRAGTHPAENISDSLDFAEELDEMTDMNLLQRLGVKSTGFSESDADRILVSRELTEDVYRKFYRAENPEEFEDVLAGTYEELDSVQGKLKKTLINNGFSERETRKLKGEHAW